MAILYTSFTKSKEAEATLKLLAASGYMVLSPKVVGATNLGGNGEHHLSVDTELGYVGVSERQVYRNAVFVYSTGELATRAINAINAGDMK